MLSLILLLIINRSSAVTLESHCLKYSFSRSNIQKIETKKDECVSNIIGEKFKTDFFVRGFKKDKFIVLGHAPVDTEFCKMPADTISELDIKNKNNKILWSSENNFRNIVLSTVTEELVKRDPVTSKKSGQNTCESFPAFYRIKKFGKNMFPASVNELNAGGYMLLSSSLQTVFFFDQKIEKIIFTLNFPDITFVKDAVFERNGTLNLLVDTSPVSKKIKNTCLQKWDVGTATMMMNFCNLKDYKDQIILNLDDKIMHAYIDKGALFIETTGDEKSKIVASISGVGDFSLANAFVLDEEMKNTKSEKRGPLK